MLCVCIWANIRNHALLHKMHTHSIKHNQKRACTCTCMHIKVPFYGRAAQRVCTRGARGVRGILRTSTCKVYPHMTSMAQYPSQSGCTRGVRGVRGRCWCRHSTARSSYTQWRAAPWPGHAIINGMGVKNLNSGSETCFSPATRGAGVQVHLKSSFLAPFKRGERCFHLEFTGPVRAIGGVGVHADTAVLGNAVRQHVVAAPAVAVDERIFQVIRQHRLRCGDVIATVPPRCCCLA